MINQALILNCEQGSQEWLQARRGIPTASQFDRIITTGGKLSGQSTSYLAELLAERLGAESSDLKTEDMERGTALEPQARKAYEFETGDSVEQVGGIYLDETKSVLCSPDGLIPAKKRGIEIKCPKLKTHIRYILEDVLPGEYLLQVQGALLITGYETWDFISYCPEYPPCDIWIKTVERDETLIKQLRKALTQFCERLALLSEKQYG